MSAGPTLKLRLADAEAKIADLHEEIGSLKHERSELLRRVKDAEDNAATRERYDRQTYERRGSMLSSCIGYLEAERQDREIPEVEKRTHLDQFIDVLKAEVGIDTTDYRYGGR